MVDLDLDLRPDIVIDMICFTLDSARHLVEALRGHVQHFLHCGTIWVHGPSRIVPTTEAQPRRPALGEMPSAGFIAALDGGELLPERGEGHEAVDAAVTMVVVGTSGVPARQVEITLDRPFFYAIVDTLTGSVLFLGAVQAP